MSINNLQEFKGCIASIDFSKRSIEEIFYLISPFFDGVSNFGIRINPGLQLFRGIKYAHKPAYILDIIYPPKEKAHLGRANRNGESMFYAASTKKAVFYELGLNKGDKLILSTWELQDQIIVNNVGFSENNLISLGSNSVTDRTIKTPEDNDVLFYDYVSKIFSRPITTNVDDIYNLSVAIAELYLKSNEFSGLLYPTIKLNGNEDNFVFRPWVVDNKLLLVSQIEFVEILDIINSDYEYEIIDIAMRFENGSIDWMEMKERWKVSTSSPELYFIINNGSIKAFNSEGDEVRPN